MKKAVKKSAPKKNNEKRDQYTVVLEDLRSNFKAFGENLDFVRKDISEIRDDLKEVKKTVGDHTRVLGSHTEMIGRIMIDVEEIKSGMREKVDRAEFTKLEKRMVMLEAVVFGGKKK